MYNKLALIYIYFNQTVYCTLANAKKQFMKKTLCGNEELTVSQ